MDYESKILARIKAAKEELEDAKTRLKEAKDNFSGKELDSERQMCRSIIEATTFLIENLEDMTEDQEGD